MRSRERIALLDVLTYSQAGAKYGYATSVVMIVLTGAMMWAMLAGSS